MSHINDFGTSEMRPLLCTYDNDDNNESSTNISFMPKTEGTDAESNRDINKNILEALDLRKSWKQYTSRRYTKSNKFSSWTCRLMRRKHIFAIFGLLLLILYIHITLSKDSYDADKVPVLHYSHVPGMKGYLVWSERCKMPNIDPYLPEVMKYFKREKFKPCSKTKPLTRVDYNATSKRYVLQVIKEHISEYSTTGNLDCCYQVIERNYTGIDADKEVSLSECISFKKKTSLASTVDNILVKCRVKKSLAYINGHAMMPERKELRERLDTWKLSDNKTNHKATSLLILGIDSISRINLIRAMPKTAQYLYDNEWFEMSGYNKMDDNTFPNLMAVLTGQNKANASRKCAPTKLYGLNNCSLIWNTFRDHGYVTAYAEDETSINTFNYLKLGFVDPPVDFYLRPFLLSAEKNLRIQRKSNLIYCLGHQHSASFVYDYAIELAKRFKNDPFFGLFWTNTFSHNAISDPSSMDGKVVEYLEKFSSLGTLQNTIIIFFSDHGMRFGPTRKTLSGHLEERLPFLFLWLPQHLKQKHPEFVNALSVNKNRLTNPYDLHMTLKNVLSMSGRVDNKELLSPAEDCPRCQSLLAPVPHNRSCDEIAIEDHWCTCIPYQSIYKNSKTVLKLAKSTVSYINNYVSSFRNGSFASMCLPLKFGNVENAYRAQQGASFDSGNSSEETYRIIFYTKPNKALFEATVRYNPYTEHFAVTGEISRLNSYSSDSECVEDGGAKKYCSCRKKKFF
ncbi:uncharacterized protein LOC119662137 isoform X2 [Teleopsis dalmanni]|uniref:uncharacterized protein LOC119662137 isoform X2 n=1 Tax=Teleopsis dalmanni TaxID=139649 RepID=UPI0018CFCC11|nr:uncharacterized protein LOC119662137 isoform X2 [Teleopsis dalmanni]